MKLSAAILSLALLTGCATAPQAPESPQQPSVRLMRVFGQLIACVAPAYGQGAQWPAVCARVGAWMPCTETAELIGCHGLGERGTPARWQP